MAIGSSNPDQAAQHHIEEARRAAAAAAAARAEAERLRNEAKR